MAPRILIIPGSDREGSFNVQLAGAIAKSIAMCGGEPAIASLHDYALPLFSQNLEQKLGVPYGARKLGGLMEKHQGIVLVSPEYNGSLPPLLKNALDWLSRDLEDIKPYQNRVFALASCSPGGLGGIRALSHLRDVLVSVGADMITPQLAVGGAGSAFSDTGDLLNDRPKALLQNLSETLIDRAQRIDQD